MAVKPIDLQTLFVQMNQVGKQQSAEKEGVAMQSFIQGNTLQKISDDKGKTVQTTQDEQLGSMAIKDEDKKQDNNKRHNAKNEEEDEEKSSEEVIKDYHLGNHIDIMG